MTSIVRLVFSAVGEVCRVMEKDAERHEKLYGGLKSIMDEMEIVEALIKEKEPRGAVQEVMARQLQDLAYDIEDFVEDLWEPGQYGRVLVALGMDRRPRQLERIGMFEKKITSLKNEWKKIAESSDGEDTSVPRREILEQPGDATSGPPPHEDSQPVELQGIEVPKREILELLSPSPAEGQQLRVVSIVGCHGVGKTALARAVYEDRRRSASQEFDCVAWVVASRCDNKKDLLDKILQSVRAALQSRRVDNENVTMESEGASDLNDQDILLNNRTDNENVTIQAEGASTTNLHDILLDKRCLVFIDDVQQLQMWKETVDACPLFGSKSRIIVTTAVRSVATACSSGSYVYTMQCLGDADSDSLFWRNVYGQQRKPNSALATASKSILRKCGGLPLALATVAKHLYLKVNDLNSELIEDVGQNLGKDYLLGNNNAAMSVFKGMRRVLRQCYDNLPDYEHRSFLLYLSIFPRGHQIKSRSLVRRLRAEGLVANECCKCFDELIDRCIIEPVQILNNSLGAKSCRVHDIVLEYVIQKSVDKNVVTLIQGREPLLIGSTGACVRRLSIQSSTKERFDELEHKCAALRSLTLFKSEHFDIKTCKMLRLLDLEGCRELGKKFLEGLCDLELLRYLSLRKTTGVNNLPTEIRKLQRLVTLDIRETNVEKLTMEVIMLPKLAYLFGQFQLPDIPNGKVTDSLSDFLTKKSELHTLAGFVATKRQSPEHVILLARNLKKVKVWCKIPEDTRRSFLVQDRGSSSSQKKRMWSGETKKSNPRCKIAEAGTRSNSFDFIRLLKMRFTSLESVSIVSTSGHCKDFMASLEGPCTITSIKLRGNLDNLPDSNKLSELGRIKNLQLSSTGLTIKDLSTLQYLRGLEYLKLEEYCDAFCNSIFIVEKNGFESLKSLCINAPMVPKLQFHEGAMQSLTSLQLRCPNSQNQLPTETVEGISHLANLSEVILHSSMQQAWETVANGNPNRPCVKRQMEQTA
ncbi:disease resistance protein RGA4-like [Miscanthus floridulus]|uniref:disease resistance protein RGA4-like n=1 Tax=Miscanthus floridulus TaxID=154761 RepID=UPI00345757BC